MTRPSGYKGRHAAPVDEPTQPLTPIMSGPRLRGYRADMSLPCIDGDCPTCGEPDVCGCMCHDRGYIREEPWNEDEDGLSWLAEDDKARRRADV